MLTKDIRIIGASGFIGKALLKDLNETYSDLCITGYSSKDCNLLKLDEVTSVFRDTSENTVVIFCAVIGRHVEESWEAMLKNALMVENISQVLKYKGIHHFIYLSSVCVYGLPVAKLPIVEQTELRPCGYYGISKVMCEHLLQMHLQAKCNVCILRIPGVYGPGDGNKSIIGKFFQQAISLGAIKVTGDGLILREFLHVSDLITAIKKFIELRFAGVVNVTSGESSSIKSIANKVSLELKEYIGEIEICRVKAEGLRDVDLVFDTSKLKSLLKNERFLTYSEGIREYANVLVQGNLL